MSEQKRFTKQNLNEKDYKVVEKGAGILRTGLKGVALIAVGTASVLKAAPAIIKGINDMRKG